MSTTGDGNPGPWRMGRPSRCGGAQAGARDGVDRSSEPRRATPCLRLRAGGARGGLRRPGEAALEGGNAEEESDIGAG